jgi:hypothetical protein
VGGFHVTNSGAVQMIQKRSWRMVEWLTVASSIKHGHMPTSGCFKMLFRFLVNSTFIVLYISPDMSAQPYCHACLCVSIDTPSQSTKRLVVLVKHLSSMRIVGVVSEAVRCSETFFIANSQGLKSC